MRLGDRQWRGEGTRALDLLALGMAPSAPSAVQRSREHEGFVDAAVENALTLSENLCTQFAHAFAEDQASGFICSF